MGMRTIVSSCYVRVAILMCLLMFFLHSSTPMVLAQIPTGQDLGSVERRIADEKKQKGITEKLTEKKTSLNIENKQGEEQTAEATADQGPRTLINNIDVQGVTAFSGKKIRSIVKPYEGKELSLIDFRKIADLITNKYRTEGYVTSFAYVAPQKIDNNTLVITVTEGRVGKTNITGNKWFSQRLLGSYLDQNKDELFNYDVLRERLSFVNANPDVKTQAVLDRGETQGSTDVNVKTEDKFPYHVTLGFSDNYVSKYLERLKYSAEVKSNNFLGLGHIASAELQVSESERYRLGSARYRVPLNPRNSIGAYYINLHQRLGREIGDSEIKGTGDIVSLYYNYVLYNSENLNINVNPGFVYKDIENEVLGTVNSEDRMRIAKVGFDVDYTDDFKGRTIVTQEFDWGLDVFGGLEKKDASASRTGAGGEFFSSITNAARVQSLPYDASLMLRGAMQLSEYNLASSEQFFIGGPTTVRGYPISDCGGDKGYNLSTELYIPPYFIPKDVKVPYTESKLYEALRFLVFVDMGYVSNNNPQSGEEKREDLYSVGPGCRFTIPNRLTVSLDYGFAIGQKSSDGSKSCLYLDVKLYF